MAYASQAWTKDLVGKALKKCKDDGIFGAENTYSTEEQKIGYWIDGKPVYRKVINWGTTAISDTWNATNATSVISPLNVKMPISVTCISPSASLVTAGRIIKYSNTWYISSELGMDAGVNKYIIFEYTKTTD